METTLSFLRAFPSWLRRSLAALSIVLTCQGGTLFGQGVAGKSGELQQSQDRETIARLEDDWLNAISKADVDEIAQILADDFLRPAPESGGFVGKADLLRWYRSHLLHQDLNKKRIENLKTSVYGSTALARGLVVTVDPAGKIVSKLLFTDVFVRRNGKWQAVSAQENAVAISPAS